MQQLAFTIAIGCVSRMLITRDRLLRLPKKVNSEDGALRFSYSIPSSGSVLDAVLMTPAGDPPKAAVLICHGIGETVGHWEAAQRLLARDGIASLVFNYSGYARSTGRVGAAQFERDAIAAFQFLAEVLPAVPISLLGFSMGSGVATAIVTRVNAKRLVLCAAFTSFREAASRILPRAATRVFSAIWETEDALRTCTVPVLIIHGEADGLFPVQMARTLEAACITPCELVLVPGLAHNDPIYRPQTAYWSFIAARVSAS